MLSGAQRGICRLFQGPLRGIRVNVRVPECSRDHRFFRLQLVQPFIEDKGDVVSKISIALFELIARVRLGSYGRIKKEGSRVNLGTGK